MITFGSQVSTAPGASIGTVVGIFGSSMMIEFAGHRLVWLREASLVEVGGEDSSHGDEPIDPDYD